MDEAVPAWDWFNQGSYEMGTGIKPLNGGDYDIDIGVYFELDVDKYKDPVEVKQWVCKALDGHTNSVDIKEPCVRVEYSVGGEPKYHVDLAIYGYEEGIILSDTYQLARGKLNFIMDK
jgi:predicted nucleotidyltransferase